MRRASLPMIALLSACQLMACQPPTTSAADTGPARDGGVVGAGEDATASDAGTTDAGTDAAPPPATCPPTGPTGPRVGDIAPDVTLMDCDGNPHSLRALCDKDAVWIVTFAAWCPFCRAFAEDGANEVYDRFAGPDFEAWMVVTEDGSYDPADATLCNTIRDQYGLTMPVLFDPGDALEDALGVPPNEAHVILGHGNRIEFKQSFGADAIDDALAGVVAAAQ